MAEQFIEMLPIGLVSCFFPFILGKKFPKVTLVIPAYNEEKRIGLVIKQAKLVRAISQILVVDDGSKDNTGKIAKELGAEVIGHHKNLGKGEALKTGIAHSKNNILLFLDADLMNINPKKIKALINPVIKDKADFVKSGFKLKRGRITEFAVKPMMKILHPDTKFKQPVSGQFVGKKDFLEKIAIEPKWGIDIALLLDAIKHGQRVVEVDIGEITHKGRPPEEKAQMSKEVMETMLQKAGFLCNKHKVIFFSDKTLTNGFSGNAKLFLDKLRKKQINTVLIAAKEPKAEIKDSFNSIKIIKSSVSSKGILSVAKRIARKFDANLKTQGVLLANKSKFDRLAKECNLSFCLKKAPLSLVKQSKEISSPSDVLMFLE